MSPDVVSCAAAAAGRNRIAAQEIAAQRMTMGRIIGSSSLIAAAS
jgi:hypothetical protein